MSTLEDLGSSKASRRRRNGRRLGFALLSLIVLVGLFGGLGPRERTARAEGIGYKLEVVHGSLVRSGQPVPLEIRIDAPSIFSGPVEIRLDAAVFEKFDFQNWYPNPDTETRTGDELIYEFEPPASQRFDLKLDARVSPNLSFGRESHWVALVVGGDEVARVDYDVLVMP